MRIAKKKAMVNKTILVVDDEAFILDMIKRHLCKTFDNVKAVLSGEEAIVALGEIKYDLVILDINLPGINGWEVLEIIKAKYPGTRVIISTASLMNEDRDEVLIRGAFDLVAKPFELSSLNDAVKLALSSNPLPADHMNSQNFFVT